MPEARFYPQAVTPADCPRLDRPSIVNGSMRPMESGGNPGASCDPIANSWFEIVGVVSDIKNNGPREDLAPEAYVPVLNESRPRRSRNLLAL
jgi:hypothetical protein